MKSGIEIVAIKRQEQITKHGYITTWDVNENKNNQLLSAIMMLVSNVSFNRGGMELPKEALEDLSPDGWNKETCWKMIRQPEIEQLAIIGAFAAAEIDRIQSTGGTCLSAETKTNQP